MSDCLSVCVCLVGCECVWRDVRLQLIVCLSVRVRRVDCMHASVGLSVYVYMSDRLSVLCLVFFCICVFV